MKLLNLYLVQHMLHQIKAQQILYCIKSLPTMISHTENSKIQRLFKAYDDFPELFRADSVYKDFSRKSSIFKYFSCEPCLPIKHQALLQQHRFKETKI